MSPSSTTQPAEVQAPARPSASLESSLRAMAAAESADAVTNLHRGYMRTLLAEIDGLRAEAAMAERDVRWSIAEDFSTFGRKHESFNWGEAHLIAREGLCVCRGGSKPCADGGVR